MPNRSPSYERWLIEQAETSEPDELTLLREEAGASPAWDWIFDILRHMIAAGLEITPDLLRHAIIEGEGRQRAGFSVPARGVSTERASFVYYARLSDQVKIGWSSRIGPRMSFLQVEELMTVEPGGRALETARHEEFSGLRINGEWFRLEDPLVAYIELLQGRFEHTFGTTFREWKVRQHLPARLR